MTKTKAINNACSRAGGVSVSTAQTGDKSRSYRLRLKSCGSPNPGRRTHSRALVKCSLPLCLSPYSLFPGFLSEQPELSASTLSSSALDLEGNCSARQRERVLPLNWLDQLAHRQVAAGAHGHTLLYYFAWQHVLSFVY